MQYNMLDIIREKDEKNLRSYLKESGKIEVLSESAQFLDKRSYLTIDTKGDIKRKKGNLALPVFSAEASPRAGDVIRKSRCGSARNETARGALPSIPPLLYGLPTSLESAAAPCTKRGPILISPTASGTRARIRYT